MATSSFFVLRDPLKLYLVQVKAQGDTRGDAGTGKRIVEQEGRVILVSKWWSGGPLSAELVLRVMVVQQFDVCEREVAPLSFAFPLPLTIDVDFGHLHHVAYLTEEKRTDMVTTCS